MSITDGFFLFKTSIRLTIGSKFVFKFKNVFYRTEKIRTEKIKQNFNFHINIRVVLRSSSGEKQNFYCKSNTENQIKINKCFEHSVKRQV